MMPPPMNKRSPGVRRLLAMRVSGDAAVGDIVRVAGRSGSALVEQVNSDGCAWVVWKDGSKDYLPLTSLHVKRPKATGLDTRRRGE